MTPRGSVVIPAHNERETIGRCLAALTGEAAEGELEVVVVANGCHDETAEIARTCGYPVHVIEIATASKVAALNAGDDSANAFPRLYLDADVEITAAAVRALFDALDQHECLVARPPVRFVSDESSWLVRKYYEARAELPGAVDRISGGGAYALSKDGRRRFDRFPDLVGDDLFVERLFEKGEWKIVDADAVAVRAPKRLSSLLTVLQRTYRGNAEQQETATTSSSTRRDVTHLFNTNGKRSAAVAYAALAVAGRVKARQARAGTSWERDDSARSMPDRSLICGIEFDRLTLGGAVDAVERLVESGEQHHVVTANVDHVVMLRGDPAFRAAYADASLILADGAPIAALSRLGGRSLPGRVAGADLFAPLLARAGERDWKVFVLGGKEGSIESARARLAREHPGLILHGHCPPMSFERNPKAVEAAVAELRAAAPNLVFLALGAPKQELFWLEHAEQLPPMVAISSGAALDFYASLQRRAPERMQQLGLEWLFRGVTEPRLLKRYFGRDLRFFRIAASDLAGRLPPLDRNASRRSPPR